MKRIICFSAAVFSLLFMSGCSTTEEGTLLGGFGGAGLGAIIGSQSGHLAGGAAIGGAAGAAAGALIGSQLD